jgi:hypothetical protein
MRPTRSLLPVHPGALQTNSSLKLSLACQCVPPSGQGPGMRWPALRPPVHRVNRNVCKTHQPWHRPPLSHRQRRCPRDRVREPSWQQLSRSECASLRSAAGGSQAHRRQGERCTYLNLFAVFTLAEQGEFSVSGGSQSSHRLMRIYVTSSNTLDWPVRAFCADSIASNSRAFSFADRSFHAHLSKRTHIAFERTKHSRKVWGICG